MKIVISVTQNIGATLLYKTCETSGTGTSDTSPDRSVRESKINLLDIDSNNNNSS